MRRFPYRPRNARLLALLLSLACMNGVLALAAAPTSAARRAPAAPLQAAETHSVRQISLLAKDLIVDPVTQTIYASRPSAAGAVAGNSITAISPATGAIGAPVFVGSEPGKMAVSDDGQFIYVLLEGASAIRRFDLTTQTAGPQFSFGVSDFDGPIVPRDFAVQPGNPGTLAVFRSAGFSSSSAFAVYDNGVQRGATASPGFFDTPTGLTFSKTDPSLFYVLGGSTLRRMTVSPAGVAQASTSSVTGSGAIKFDNGRLYTSSGHVLEPSTGGLLGTFTGTNMGNSLTPFVPDSKAGRTYFLTTPSFSSGSTTTATLRAFDQQTFVSAGTIDIPGVVGTPTSLVRWGANGLAFATTGGQLFLIQTTLVPSAEPVPTPTPAPSPFPTPTPVPTPPIVPAFVREVALTANDIIYNRNSGHIFASVPSTAGARGNSITSVDPAAGTVGAPVFVGSEPNKLAVSDNGQYVYVGLDGAAAVRRYDINAGTAGLQFQLGPPPSSFSDGPFFVEDMEVMPGHAETVAVSRRNTGSSPRHEGVAVYDDGVQRGTVTPDHTGSNVIEFSASPDTLYGLNTETSEFGFRKMSVTASGVAITRTTRSVVSGFGGNIEFDAGRVYFSSGRVIDAETTASVGTFQNIGFGNIVIPDSSVGRTFFVSGTDQFGSSSSTVSIRVFDQERFVQVGTIQVGGVRGSVRAAVRWGDNGLAIATTGGQLFLVQSSLIAATDPAPTPTPTPPVVATPTPTPAATPAPGQLRQVALATNDLVVDPVTQTIFASVPGSAGAGGNSITPIDPAAGTAGASVFVGSEPNKMAISDDGRFIYVGLDGAGSVRRFDVAARTAGLQFTLGTATTGTLVARDIAVTPGQPGTVAVARRTSGNSGAGTAVYDEGVMRPTVTSGFGSESTVIEFSANPSVLYGVTGDSSDAALQKLAVASCGVVPIKSVPRVVSAGFGADFDFENGVGYSSTGRSADVEAGTIRGTYAPTAPNSFPSGTTLVAADAKAGRVYFLVTESGSVFLRVFDMKTFLRVGELRLPGVTGTLSSLVRWGANGLAFRNTAGQVYLLQHSLVGGTDPSFTPAPPPPTPTLSAAGTVSTFNGGDPGGVTLAVTGSLTTTVTSGADGKFSITGLPPCGSFTVTPSKTNYVFSPTSQTVTNPLLTSNLSFTATLKTLGFQQNSVVVQEGASKVVVFVTRNAGANEAASVSYETEPGTASDRTDFNRTIGTLNFAPGETSKGITVLLGGDDTLSEGNETFTLKLKDPNGAALSQNFSATAVTIIDNDAQQGAANPLQNARFFVARHYQDFLNRDAADDPQGWSFWADQIAICNEQPDAATKAACFADRRVNVSAAFFLSIEFQQTGYLAHRFYTASFPDSAARPKGLPRFSEFLRDTQELGRGVVVGRTGWEAQLEANKQAFALAWVGRAEFLAAHPVDQPAGEYVDSLFQNAGAVPTAAERAAAVAAFGAGGAEGRARSLRSVADSLSVYTRQFNSAFVLMQYFGYLRRAPNEAPDNDFSGYQHWLDNLNRFSLPGEDVRNEAVVLTRIRRSEMVTAFLVSHEYMTRFGPANFDITK